jgi:hypothetical protein
MQGISRLLSYSFHSSSMLICAEQHSMNLINTEVQDVWAIKESGVQSPGLNEAQMMSESSRCSGWSVNWYNLEWIIQDHV